MSGTAYGTIMLHIAPEAAIGGPLAVDRNGDRIKHVIHPAEIVSASSLLGASITANTQRSQHHAGHSRHRYMQR